MRIINKTQTEIHFVFCSIGFALNAQCGRRHRLDLLGSTAIQVPQARKESAHELPPAGQSLRRGGQPIRQVALCWRVKWICLCPSEELR